LRKTNDQSATFSTFLKYLADFLLRFLFMRTTRDIIIFAFSSTAQIYLFSIAQSAIAVYCVPIVTKRIFNLIPYIHYFRRFKGYFSNLAFWNPSSSLDSSFLQAFFLVRIDLGLIPCCMILKGFAFSSFMGF